MVASTETKPDAKEAKEDGAETATCDKCGAVAKTEARFCTECGTPLSLRRGASEDTPWYRRRNVLIASAIAASVVAIAGVVLLMFSGEEIVRAAQAPFMDRISGQWACSSDDGATATLVIAPGTFAFDTRSPTGMTAALRGTWAVQDWKIKIQTTEGGGAPNGAFTPIDLGGRFELVTENAQGTINSDLAKPFLELNEGDHTAILRFTFNGRRIQVVCGK